MYSGQQIVPTSKSLTKKFNDWRSVFFISKYNYELKKKIAMSYLNGIASYKDLTESYKIPSNTYIQE